MASYDSYPRNHNTDQTGGAISGTSLQTMTLAAAGALAIDWSQGECCVATLQANASSVTMSNPIAGKVYTLTVVQDATGSRTWTSGPATVKWMNTAYLGGTAGTIPTLTTTAAKRDTFIFFYDGTNYLQVAQVLNS